MKKTERKSNKKLSKGFTLVELMVSLTIFSIVMLVSLGTLLIMIDVNAKAQAIYSSTSNLTFAIDSMTREIRTGYNYHCSNNPPEGGFDLPIDNGDCTEESFIAFTREEDGVRIGYRLEGTRLEQKTAGGVWVPLTSDDVMINNFEITVVDSDPYYPSGDVQQPKVDLFINGSVNNGLDTDTDFSIQSRVIQRRLDII